MEVAHARVLVTGGGRRVGRELCNGLEALGAEVAFTYRGTAPASAAGQHAIEADLADADAARGAVERASALLGGLDVLVHAASGGFTPVEPELVTPELFDEALGATLRGGFFCAQAARAAMTEGGVIIFLTDVAIHQAWPRFAPHAAAKAGLAQLTRSLAKAWGPGVRVCSIAPGPVLMPDGASDESIARHGARTALGRLGSPDDLVQAIAYLVSAEFVTGSELVVDGGYRL